MASSLSLSSDRAEAGNRECQGTLGEEVDLAETITPTNLIVKDRTETGLYEYIPRRSSEIKEVFAARKALSSFEQYQCSET